MRSIYNRLFQESDEHHGTNGTATTKNDSPDRVSKSVAAEDALEEGQAEATESTNLLNKNATRNSSRSSSSNSLFMTAREQEDSPPSSYDFFFNRAENPTIQRYYKFTSTALLPIAALHKRPTLSSSTSLSQSAGVTGLLRRSAVVPSHGTDSTGQWILVSVGGRSGWARRAVPVSKSKTANGDAATMSQQQQMLSTPRGVGLFHPVPSFAAHEAWMGNHSFFCRGKIMLGSDAPSLFFTTILILVGVVIHCLHILPALQESTTETITLPDGTSRSLLPHLWLLSNPTAMWLCTILASVGALASLWRTALMDPGILPSLSAPIKAPPPLDEHDNIVPMGGALGYRYCSTCNIFRPPRSKHCNSCNVCVSKFDHHCPWVSNCVGERNYSPFVLFLAFVSVLTTLTTAASFAVFAAILHKEQIDFQDSEQHPKFSKHEAMETLTKWEITSHLLGRTVCKIPLIVLFGIFTALCAWSLISLLLYHARIISIGETTNENVRKVYASGSIVNPADHGFCRNWWECCRELYHPPASRIPRDFSEIVYQCMDVDESVWMGETYQGTLSARPSSTALNA